MKPSMHIWGERYSNQSLVWHKCQSLATGQRYHQSISATSPFLTSSFCRKPLNNFPSRPAGELFAQAPVTEYPGVSLETVSDSSRYFVLRIQDDNGEEVDDNESATNDLVLHCLSVTVAPSVFRRTQCVYWRWLRGPRGLL